MAGFELTITVAEIGNCQGDQLCPGAMACPDVYFENGEVEIDNNVPECALRIVAPGRKIYLFAGSEAQGESAASVYSVLGSAKPNQVMAIHRWGLVLRHRFETFAALMIAAHLCR